MRVGIVAEGPADIAVLRNILAGKLGLQQKDSIAIRPELSEDETDLAENKAAGGYRAPTPETYSNWTIVLEECRSRTRIAEFLESPLAGERLVIIHIDTAEAHHKGYDIARPERKAADYCDRLRALVVQKINDLLGPDLAKEVRHAVAVEETDAWVLTIHDDQDTIDTCTRADPKKRLCFVLDRQGSKMKSKPSRNDKTRAQRLKGGQARQKQTSEYDLHDGLSLYFRELTRLEACAERNRSLKLFVDSLG